MGHRGILWRCRRGWVSAGQGRGSRMVAQGRADPICSQDEFSSWHVPGFARGRDPNALGVTGGVAGPSHTDHPPPSRWPQGSSPWSQSGTAGTSCGAGWGG